MIIDVFILIFSIAILIITYRMSTLYYIFKEIEDGGCKVGPKSPVMKIFIPISVHLGSIINSLIGIKESYRVNLLLIGADVDDIMKTSDFVAFRLITTSIGVLLGFVICRPTDVIVIFLFGGAGCVFPTLYLKNIAGRRRKSIEEEMPYLLDMLTLSVEAGMDFVQAIIRIKDRMKTCPMKEELVRFEVAVRGGSRRVDALSMISNRLRIPSITSFVSLLVQADRFGTGIGSVLRSQSRRLRSERLIKAEEMGAKASQKILLPLIFCIMPTTFIVVFGPIAIRLLNEGLGAMFQ